MDKSILNKKFKKLSQSLLNTSQILLDKAQTKDYNTEKKEDGSIVTSVDFLANEKIKTHIKKTFGKDANIVSEENNKDENLRNINSSYFLIDPIDGTTALTKGEKFCINIAYIVNKTPILGAIAIPIEKKVFCTIDGGVFVLTPNGQEKINPHQVKEDETAIYTMIANHRSVKRNNKDFNSEDMKKILLKTGMKIQDKILSDVAAVKYCMLAKGDGDFSVSFGSLKCWDLAASYAILSALKIKMLNGEGKKPDFSLEKEENVLFASGSKFLLESLIKAFKDK